MRIRVVVGSIVAALAMVQAGCSTGAAGTGESVEAISSSTNAAVKAKLADIGWSAVSTPRIANGITFSSDGTFTGSGGCPQDGTGPHCFAIIALSGTWSATKSTLTLTFRGNESKPEIFKWTEGPGPTGGTFLTLTRNGFHYSFSANVGGGGVLPIVPSCKTNADCTAPINFLCEEAIATRECDPKAHICKAVCKRPVAGGGGVLPVLLPCDVAHKGDANGAGKGSCIERELVLVDGCGRGSIDQHASCGAGEVCCVAPTKSDSKTCLFDADCGDPSLFCLRPLTFASHPGFVNANGHGPTGLCISKIR
jgi:hypothetical protein